MSGAVRTNDSEGHSVIGRALPVLDHDCVFSHVAVLSLRDHQHTLFIFALHPDPRTIHHLQGAEESYLPTSNSSMASVRLGLFTHTAVPALCCVSSRQPLGSHCGTCKTDVLSPLCGPPAPLGDYGIALSSLFSIRKLALASKEFLFHASVVSLACFFFSLLLRNIISYVGIDFFQLQSATGSFLPI